MLLSWTAERHWWQSADMLSDRSGDVQSGTGWQKIGRRLILIGIFILANSLYMINNQLVINHDRAIVWEWAIDSYIPLLPVFIIPYFYWYIQIIITMVWFLFSRRHPDMLRYYVTAIAIAALIANLIFILLPTYVPRPDITGSDIFSRALRLLYQMDKPYNCFPSLHVAFTCIAGWFWHKAGPHRFWFRLFNAASCVMIVLATVFTRQHYLPDIPGGMIVAAVAITISTRILKSGKVPNPSIMKKM